MEMLGPHGDATKRDWCAWQRLSNLYTELLTGVDLTSPISNRLPELHKRVKDAAFQVDCENWGICKAALDAGEPGDKLNTRYVGACRSSMC